MSHYKSFAVATAYLICFTFCAVAPAGAIPGICLFRTPAPPDAALNDGTDSVTFSWTIEYLTTCNQPYTLEIIDPSDTVIDTILFPCAPSIIADSHAWNVPLNADAGCYYGRLTFFSDWCNGFPGKFEDQATTGFLVKSEGRFRICKFHDLDGSGCPRDPEDPPLAGWQFNIERPCGNVIETVITGSDGCVEVSVPVEPGGTVYCIREIVQSGWTQTCPDTNPFEVLIMPGDNPEVLFGNWRPIFISGFKYLDQAPWPWTEPHYVGLEGQQNPPEWEPVPPCPPPDPLNCFSPDQIQPYPFPIAGVVVNLYNADKSLLIGTTVTGIDGKFIFGPTSYNQQYVIEEENPGPVPPECDTKADEGGLVPWPGDYFSTVATSVWPSPVGVPCPNVQFANPDRLDILLPEPTVPDQEYSCNYFFNRQPSRLWGLVCQETLQMSPDPLPSSTIVVEKIVDAVPEAWPQPNPSWNPVTGFYMLDVIPVEPQGIRQGLYRLTPPAPLDPTKFQWEVTLYCDDVCLDHLRTFSLPASGFVEVEVPHSCDIRVDFCLVQRKKETRCYLPVTLTQQGWHDLSDVNSPIVPGGMVYNRFWRAFADFSFFGTLFHNRLLVGKNLTITFEGTTGGLIRLCLFLPQTGPCGKLDWNYLNPWDTTPAGALAGEAVALTMNIAYNDKRLMPRTPGYDLEDFTLASGLFKGKTVGEVLVIADRVLSGETPPAFGLPDCEALVEILQAINANYEFVDFDTFNDRRFLIPNRAFGPPDPPHDPSVP